MVVVDLLTKSACFLPVQSKFGTTQISIVFIKEIFWLHAVPKMIVSDRDHKLTTTFWRALFKIMVTKFNFNTAYHPQTNGQNERVNQILEDILKMYVMDKYT